MTRGTTPLISISCTQDLREWQVDMKAVQDGLVIDLSPTVALNGGTCFITAQLTQEQTYALIPEKWMEVQVRASKDGWVIMSPEFKYFVKDSLFSDVISFEWIE